jgi:hypothetical protein
MICSAGQASPWFWLMLISSIIFWFGFFWRLWLTYASCQMIFMSQESGVVELHFDCHYKCTIWILNQVKLLRCWAYCRYLSSSYILFALYPYVSMGIVSCLGELPAIDNVWTDFIWSYLFWETYVNLCRLLTNESRDSIWIVSCLYWIEDPHARSTSVMTLIGWITIFSCGADIPVMWLCVLWEFLTIIFMVFETILSLHSSTMSYYVNGLICFLLMFVSIAKLIKPYQYSI